MADRTKFVKLLEPGNIGRVRTKNRIIKTASGTGMAEPGGIQGERIKGYYEALAKGGVGLIINEFTAVEHPRGARWPTGTEARIDDDRFIAGFSEVTKAVHKYGCPIFLQIFHSGPWYAPNEAPENLGDRIGPSTYTPEEFREIGELVPENPVVPREMSLADIEEVIDSFAKAAVRGQKAGFDGVEINGSHHHLINCFCSRVWNRRHDAYGCDSLENRARFLCDIVREVKKRCGSDYAVTTLFNVIELGVANGTTLEEGRRFGQILQEAGSDALQPRMAGYGSFGINFLQADKLMHPELPKALMRKEFDWSRKGRGFSLPLAAELKAIATVPVFLAGRLDAELGEELLREGKLDFIGMTRRLLADPEYPNKIAEGRLEDIVPCAACLYCMHSRSYEGKPVECRMNPSLGREKEFAVKPAAKKKKVLIAGGGPAGMEAAKDAAMKGHEVVLYEKERQLGGLMLLAAVVKDFESGYILDQIEYFKTQLSKTGVTIKLGKEVDSAAIAREKPDVIVLGVGGVANIPAIPGIDSAKVVDNSKLHGMLKTAMRFLGPKSLEQMSKLWMPVGKRVVVMGGSIVGCQLAEFLVKRGKQVTIVEEAEKLGDGLLAEDPFRTFTWFKQKGVVMMPGVKYKEITDKGLVIATKDGKTETIEADSILTALPLMANLASSKAFEGKAKEIYVIGDCKQSGFMHNAIRDGATIGHSI